MQFKLINLIIIVTLLCLTKLSKQTALGETPGQFTENIHTQLNNDVFLIKTGLIQVQVDMNQLNSHLEEQTTIIQKVESHLFRKENFVDQCDMTDFFQNIDNKLMKIKYKIHQVVNDHDDEHMDKFEKIMHNVKKAAHDCASTENEKVTALKAQITAKLLEFDKLMVKMQELEDKLTSPPIPDEEISAANTDLTNLLNEINTKLNVQQEKLVKLETIIPDLQNATLSLEIYKKNQKAICHKKSCISKKILALTQNATKNKI